MNIITSRSNDKIINACKLKQKKYRDKTSLFFFEGIKLFIEAQAAGLSFSDVFITEKALRQIPEPICAESVSIVSNSVYEKLTEEQSPDGIFCIAHKYTHPGITNQSKFIISSVQDPGNIGTMIRSALAFDIGELILSADCADIFSAKVIRAAMGASFRQCIRISNNLPDEIDNLAKSGYNLCAAALSQDAKSLTDLQVDQKVCFVVGNEGHGLSPEIISACGNQVKIPIGTASESLNASIAAAILMWELKRNTLYGNNK